MLYQTKIVDIELSQPLEAIADLDGYRQMQGLLRWQGQLLGCVYLPVSHGECSLGDLVQAIVSDYSAAIAAALIRQRLATASPGSWEMASLLQDGQVVAETSSSPPLPTVTVVLCPRLEDAPHLAGCLASLHQGSVLPFQVIVAVPSLADPWQSIQVTYPDIQWLVTPEPHRSAQRNLALAAAQGEVVAFLDASCQADPQWLAAIAATFAHNPEIAMVTGAVIPAALKTDVDAWFEQGYSPWRGCDRSWHQHSPSGPVAWTQLGTMQIGSGMNMAMRRSLTAELDPFDIILDRLESTWEGADLDWFNRVLLSGRSILYEPTALVRYPAPSTRAAARARVAHIILGLYAYIMTSWQKYPALRWQWATLGAWKLARLAMALVRPYQVPRRFILSELMAVGRSWFAYSWARRQTASTAASHPAPVGPLVDPAHLPQRLMAVRTVELHQPMADLTDVTDYRQVRVVVTADGRPIGHVDIDNAGHPVSQARLHHAIATTLTTDILALAHQGDTGMAWSALQTALRDWLLPAIPTPAPAPVLADLARDVSVSIVITTCDRPEDLDPCLRHLLAQDTQRSVEIIVADNRPASGMTPPVVARFPQVKLVQEPRPGGSYGRNAAIAASTGEIVVTVDDDVTVPPDWLEKLIAPMARPEVMVVTGNLLPKELDTPAQYLFETLKGGLGAGFQRFEVDGQWLASFQRQSPPVWDLGVSANAAFRASIFAHPAIGLMDEVLGPGTPTVGGEENHLIYKVLKAGYTLVYEPDAYAWHRHRRDMAAFYRQVAGHMKGGTAYHLVLWLREQDLRGRRQLVIELPRYYTRRLYERLRGWHHTPWRLLGCEIWGYVAGFWGYWQSCQRVQKQGRSAPYVPVAERSPVVRPSPSPVSPSVVGALDGPPATPVGGCES